MRTVCAVAVSPSEYGEDPAGMEFHAWQRMNLFFSDDSSFGNGMAEHINGRF